MLLLNHKKLNVYQKSIESVSEIYFLTQHFPSHEKFGLTSQLRRSAISVPSNIAEGAARKTAKERKRFYQISRSSLVELDTQIGISLSLNYLTKEQINKLEKNTNELFAMLSAMI